jgi:hypothetical protein
VSCAIKSSRAALSLKRFRYDFSRARFFAEMHLMANDAPYNAGQFRFRPNEKATEKASQRSTAVRLFIGSAAHNPFPTDAATHPARAFARDRSPRNQL